MLSQWCYNLNQKKNHGGMHYPRKLSKQDPSHFTAWIAAESPCISERRISPQEKEKKTHKAEEIINCTDIFLRVKEMEETSCSTSSSPLAFGISSSTPSVPEREWYALSCRPAVSHSQGKAANTSNSSRTQQNTGNLRLLSRNRIRGQVLWQTFKLSWHLNKLPGPYASTKP